MKKYNVWVDFSGCAMYTVEADSEQEALDIAIEYADPYDCENWDYNCNYDNIEIEGDEEENNEN